MQWLFVKKDTLGSAAAAIYTLGFAAEIHSKT